MLHGNAIIGQSGGPTSVINASLCGIVQQCLAQKAIGKTLGMRFGIEGFMRGDVIDLGREAPATIEGLRTTPSSALGSCRHKLKDADFPRILEMLKRHDIRYFFLIGGNDTMDTIHRVEKYCREQGYELIGVGVPKTVDNDLCGTDHTPGFGSAARYVALSVKQAGMLARDMRYVDQYVIFQTVGRSAGWLPAAAALAKVGRRRRPAHHPAARAAVRSRPVPGRREALLRPLRLVQHRLRRGRVLRRRHADQRLDDHRQVLQRRVRRDGRHQRGDDAAPHDPRRLRLAGRVPGVRVAADVRRRPRQARRRGRGLRLRPPGRGTGRRGHARA